MADAVDPTQIEEELDRIWESFQGTNKMRACLFNLIIYSKKCQRLDYLNKVAQKVIEKFPSRIIFVTYDETCSNEDLRTAVSVLTADEGEHEIACDMIEIDVCKKDHPRVPFVVLPHILPDLPVYLVHADDPTQENPIAQKLEYFADRIIFDSESTVHLPDFAKAVLAHYERTKADVADLNWGRIEQWRQLFATVFKSEEELNRLQQATEISIYFNAKKTVALCHTNFQSIYLQVWIASQLGWTLKNVESKEEKITFHYDKANQPIAISLFPSKMENVSPGRILKIQIQATDDFEYQFARSEERPDLVMIEKSRQDQCFLPSHFVLDQDTSGQSLVKEICHKGTSRHYLNMLKILSNIQHESFCQ